MPYETFEPSAAGDVASIRDEQVSFDRVLATVLFTDIVDSTRTASALGDAAMQAALAAAVVSGLLVGLFGCTNVPPSTVQVVAPTAPPICKNTGEDFQPPVVKHTVAPSYPLDLRRIGANGYVIIECEIDEKGRVQNPKVIEAYLGEAVPGAGAH